jgi:CheY-like chemotaxis protein
MNDPSKPIEILVADDHPLLREGIVSLIAMQKDMRLVGEASSGRDAIEKHRLLKPDLTLMDLQMPGGDGIEAVAAIREECPEAKIVVLTTFAGDALAFRALKSGRPSLSLEEHGSEGTARCHSPCSRVRKTSARRGRRRPRSASVGPHLVGARSRRARTRRGGQLEQGHRTAAAHQ